MTATNFIIGSSNGFTAAKAWAHWAAGTTFTLPGPKWTVVEADDQTRRDKPVGGSTIEDLPTANKWHPTNGSNPASDSWLILESLNSTALGTVHLQMMIQVSDSGGNVVWDIFMFPFEDWVVDPAPNPATSVVNPTRPTREIASSQFTFNLPLSHLISAGDGTAIVIMKHHESFGTPREVQINYTGEALIMPARGAVFTEERPFIQTIAPLEDIGLDPFNGNFGRFTQAGQKVLKGAVGYERPVGGPDHQDVSTQNPSTSSGGFQLFNVSVGFFDEGSDAYGMFGLLKHLGTVNGAVGGYGHLFNKEFIYVSEAPATKNAWTLPWDGLTKLMPGGA